MICYNTLRALQLPVARRRGNVDHLIEAVQKLVKFQRTVVQCRRQAEAEIHQRGFPRAVPLEHAPHLRDADMAFVGKEHEVVGEVVEQRSGRLPFLAAVEVARVVFNARAIAKFLHHFKIKLGALLKPLRLHKLVSGLKKAQPLAQFVPDVGHGPFQIVPIRDVMAGGINDRLADVADDFPGERIDLAHGFNFVPEEFQPQGPFMLVGGDNLKHVPPHAEGAAVKVDVVALVLHVDEAGDDGIHAGALPRLHGDDQPRVVLGRAEAVNARDGGHNDHVAPRQQGVGGRVTELVDVVVDGRVFFDVGIGRGNIGFRLVIVVIADEIFDRVFREQRAELIVELRGQRLVGGEDQRRAVDAGDDVGHRKRLARARDAEQDLLAHPGLDIGRKLFNGGGLIPGGHVVSPQPEKRIFGCFHAEKIIVPRHSGKRRHPLNGEAENALCTLQWYGFSWCTWLDSFYALRALAWYGTTQGGKVRKSSDTLRLAHTGVVRHESLLPLPPARSFSRLHVTERLRRNADAGLRKPRSRQRVGKCPTMRHRPVRNGRFRLSGECPTVYEGPAVSLTDRKKKDGLLWHRIRTKPPVPAQTEKHVLSPCFLTAPPLS